MVQNATMERAAVKPGLFALPNVLTYGRIAAVPALAACFLLLPTDRGRWLSLAIFVVACITDWLDGYLARRLNQYSRFGEILDPVADRLYILAVVIGLWYRDIIPWWIALALPARDIFLWCLVPFLRTRGYSALPVHFLGKAATFSLLYAFPLLFVGDGEGTFARMALVFGWAFAIWGLALYWWAGLLYAWQVRQLLRDPGLRAPAM